ncbi:MAG: DoxX family protein [Myxococcaceae bacterium]
MNIIEKEVKEVKKIHEVFLEFDHWFESPFIFLMRVIFGALFIAEGWYKFSDIAYNTAYYAHLGIPMPEFMVYLSASAEFFGGIFMVIGFLTRLAMIPLSITMIVAAISDPGKAQFFGHGSGQTENFLAQIPLVFLYACMMTLLFGPGRWSVDYKLTGKWFLCR